MRLLEVFTKRQNLPPGAVPNIASDGYHFPDVPDHREPNEAMAIQDKIQADIQRVGDKWKLINKGFCGLMAVTSAAQIEGFIQVTPFGDEVGAATAAICTVNTVLFLSWMGTGLDASEKTNALHVLQEFLKKNPYARYGETLDKLKGAGITDAMEALTQSYENLTKKHEEIIAKAAHAARDKTHGSRIKAWRMLAQEILNVKSNPLAADLEFLCEVYGEAKTPSEIHEKRVQLTRHYLSLMGEWYLGLPQNIQEEYAAMQAFADGTKEYPNINALKIKNSYEMILDAANKRKSKRTASSQARSSNAVAAVATGYLLGKR